MCKDLESKVPGTGGCLEAVTIHSQPGAASHLTPQWWFQGGILIHVGHHIENVQIFYWAGAGGAGTVSNR